MIFFITLATLFFERWFGGPAVGVHISLLLTTKYVKRNLQIKNCSNVWFSTCTFCTGFCFEIYFFLKSTKFIMWANFILKNTFEWVSLIVEDLFIVHPYEKVNSFRDFVKVLAQSLRTHLGIYFRNVFYMTKKTYFSICLLLNLFIV